MSVSLFFGAELRRMRQEKGLSLTDFSALISYDKGYLSKVERGMRPASEDLARRCDSFFGADGDLRRFAREMTSPEDGPAVDDGAWPMGRRTLLAAGTGALVDLRGRGREEADAPAALVPSFRAQFGQFRVLGQSTAPAALLPLLEVQTRLVVEFVGMSGNSEQAALLRIASRFAEYTGWIAQEAGDNTAALGWTAEAVRLAGSSGDRHLASYAFVRRALVTMYATDAEQTVALARRAQDSSLPPRIRGLAAQREAQGHALAGDERACLRSLDRAREHLGSPDARAGDEPVLGTTNLPDPTAMSTGWCLYDLGRPREAAEVLDKECARLRPQALRTRSRYGMRRALAHAAAGEIDRSCAIAGEVLGLTTVVPSATVATDVRRLSRELTRFRTHRAVRDLQPALAAATAAAHG